MRTFKTKPATPFNRSLAENIRMFGLPLPEHLIMPVMFMESTGMLENHMVMEFLRARQLMTEVFAAGHLDPAKFGITSKIEPYITLEVNTLVILREDLNNSDWRHNGLYLQAGFADAPKVNSGGIYRAISTAQTFHDMMYIRTGSLDPAQHPPIERDVRHVQEYTQAVNGFYTAEIAVWRKQLLKYHTAVLVMLQAAWMGRDPLQEYQRFLGAGADYFLQYRQLCEQ